MMTMQMTMTFDDDDDDDDDDNNNLLVCNIASVDHANNNSIIWHRKWLSYGWLNYPAILKVK